MTLQKVYVFGRINRPQQIKMVKAHSHEEANSKLIERLEGEPNSGEYEDYRFKYHM